MAFPKHGLIATSLDIPNVGVVGIHLDAGGIGAGGTTSTNGPFKVLPNGALTATGADITGDFHALTISTASGKFGVSSGGVLTATGANVSGDIHASSGDISGPFSVSGNLDVSGGIDINGGALDIANSAGIRLGPIGSSDVKLFRGAAGRLEVDNDFKIGGQVGFFGHATGAKPNVGGSRAGNNALNQLVQALDGLGLITNNTTV